MLPHHDVGERLIGYFAAAGLPVPNLIWECLSGGSASPILPWLAGTYRTLLPHMERLGIANRDIGDPETLAERLAEDVAVVQGQVVSLPQSCAWAVRN